MSEMPQTPDKFLPSIHMMYFAMIAGIVIFAVMVVVMMGSEFKRISFLDSLFWFIALISVAFYWASVILYDKMLFKIHKNDSLQEKMKKSVYAHIVRYMLLEIPALVGVMCFLAFSNWAFLLVTVFFLFHFYRINPKKDSILNDLKLSYEERKLFNEKE